MQQIQSVHGKDGEGPGELGAIGGALREGMGRLLLLVSIQVMDYQSCDYATTSLMTCGRDHKARQSWGTHIR